MVTIGMNYQVLEGKETIFEDAVHNVVRVMSDMDGHDESRLFKEVGGDAAHYLIVSRWSSEDAFNAFIRSERFRKVTDWGAQNILAARPSHTTYAELDGTGAQRPSA